MTGFFVTASGTGIGKTFLTTGLLHCYINQGKCAHALKPVLSGFDPETADESDSGLLLGASGREVTLKNIKAITPWRFAAPLSPDMAARREGKIIDFDAIVHFSREAVNKNGTVFIEGVGGVAVPLTNTHTVLDWIESIALPTILITGSYLGAISHALTAIESVRHRNVSIAAIVVNESETSTVPLEETARVISRFSAQTPCLTMPRAIDKHASIFTKLAEILERYSVR